MRSEFPLNIYLVGQIVMRSHRSRIEDHVVSFTSNKMKAASNADASNTYDGKWDRINFYLRVIITLECVCWFSGFTKVVM